MKLESISKIFGVLAFVGFVLVILRVVGVIGELGSSDVTLVLISMPILFLLAAILTTIKRVAHDMEAGKKE